MCRLIRESENAIRRGTQGERQYGCVHCDTHLINSNHMPARLISAHTHWVRPHTHTHTPVDSAHYCLWESYCQIWTTSFGRCEHKMRDEMRRGKIIDRGN